jgi:FtsP/CotA-like multicopper oxidase with cupredoxin domain
MAISIGDGDVSWCLEIRNAMKSLLLVGVIAVGSSGCGGGQDGENIGQVSQALQRNYFIAADEVIWDYAPTGINQITGQPFGEQENVFVQQGPDRIGRRYIKALYREYTDGTFHTLRQRPTGWQHLGFLGPLIRAVVGDQIHVVFKNNTTRPVSMHPHGVFYAKNGEGAPYNDGTSGGDKFDDAVPPGATFEYFWNVPERAGPGPEDGSSAFWMYHSHTDEVADTYAGLIGPIVITRAGQARSDMRPVDVDREFVTMFEVADENQSPYLDRNIQQFAGDPGSVDPEDEGFVESNLMHSINGFVYGNLRGNNAGLAMNNAERVRWYLMGMGTEVDLHTPHWHGNVVTIAGMRTDVAQLLPATMVTADMRPDDNGTWLYHCHVNDHILAGMLALYRVDNGVPAQPAR